MWRVEAFYLTREKQLWECRVLLETPSRSGGFTFTELLVKGRWFGAVAIKALVASIRMRRQLNRVAETAR